MKITPFIQVCRFELQSVPSDLNEATEVVGQTADVPVHKMSLTHELLARQTVPEALYLKFELQQSP